MATTPTPEVQAARRWVADATHSDIAREIHLILAGGQQTDAELSDAQWLAEMLCVALNLPVGPAAEIAALRARIAELERLVPSDLRPAQA